MIFEEVRRKYDEFSKTHKKVANNLLYDYRGFAFSTLEKLSDELNVSEASIYRFARELGYEGFTDLKNNLQNHIKKEFVPLEELKDSIEANDKKKNVLYDSIKDNIAALNNLYNKNLYDKFLQTIEMLEKADHIYIFALRSSFTLSYYFSFILKQFMDNVTLLNLCYGNIYDRLKTISEKDVYFSISYPPYTDKSVEIIEYAKETGAYTIAISDSFSSPLFDRSNLSIKIETGGTYSFVPVIIFLNSLVIALGKKDKYKTMVQLDKSEDLLFDRGVYYHNR